MYRLVLLLFLWVVGLMGPGLVADDSPTPAPAAKTTRAPTWWEKRDKRADIHYPHQAHFQVMEKEGDSCLLCHGFGPNTLTDKKQLKPLTTLANEPLKAVCHDCHVDERRGPWRCELCHDDKTRIWPVDHNFGYIDHHGEAGRRDEAGCRECHLDLSFCTNCHFRRDTAGQGYHPLGYRSLHGLEARIDTLSCGRCHNTPYCDECHRAR
jgi:hypothetical protein